MTFASTGAVDALLGQGDFISQQCSLELDFALCKIIGMVQIILLKSLILSSNTDLVSSRIVTIHIQPQRSLN